MVFSRWLRGLCLRPVSLSLRRAGSVLALGTALSGCASPVADPLQQVPGVYRQDIGPLRVTALFDGVVALPRSLLVGVAPERIASLLHQRYVPEDEKGLQTAVNAYLVHTGGRLVLVDTGTAQCFGSGLGQVLGNLRQAGYAPEAVDAVLITHAHPDHLCGLLDAQGRRAYPNAQVWLPRADAAYWLDPASEAGSSDMLRPLFGMARRAVAPYAAAGQLKRFGPGDALPAGVAALPTPGHTVGHVSYLFDAGAQPPLLVWGDIVHYHAVQLAQPDAAFEADSDRAQAIASRRQLLARAVEQGWWVAGAHMPFPGLGHVRAEGGAYAWVPAEHAPLRP